MTTIQMIVLACMGLQNPKKIANCNAFVSKCMAKQYERICDPKEKHCIIALSIEKEMKAENFQFCIGKWAKQ